MSAAADAAKEAREQRARENRRPETFAGATLSCDIVMKGGITSGVVYPGAVLRLARRYRFRSIGGTSAGAIAAVVVAAAEHDRDRGGFTRVADIPEQLTKKGFMLGLFQADPPARPLFKAITGVMQHGKLVGGVLALGRLWKAPVTALAVGAASILLSTQADAGAAFAVAGVAAALAILVGGLAIDVARSIGRLPGNDFGMCRLGPQAGTPDRPALTQWLHGQIQRVAGRPENRPLSFADLWGVPAPADPARPLDDDARADELWRRSREPDARVVDLQMVTTDLTHGRPIRLPVPYQQHRRRLEEEAGRLLFDPGELAAFFPAPVLAHLGRHARPLEEAKAARLAELAGHDRLRAFPIGPDLPVVVAARMSLSFPFLIASVPLWRMTVRDDVVERLDRVRFSDGGVTSNFPIHFFDSPLPTRPTFGLHLTSFGARETPDLDDPEQAVVAPGRPSDPAPDVPDEIESLGAFAGALKNAGQNWRDNAQARLPGFRDRVVHIKLDDEEGGLNLAMPPEVIARLDDRGDLAGRKLVGLFAGPDASAPTEHWNDHRFTRYRTTMALAERWMRSYRRGWRDEPGDRVTTSYRDRVEAGLEKPYAFANPTILRTALERSEEYAAIVHEPSLDDRGIPRPPSALRTVPPV